MNTVIIAIFTCFSAAFILLLLIAYAWWFVKDNKPADKELSDFDRETKDRQNNQRETSQISDGLRYCKHCGLFCRLDKGPCPVCHDQEEIKDEVDHRYRGFDEYEKW